MAKLLSTGIYGFICSAKKVAGDLVEHFLTGFAGYGWKIWEYTTGKWMFEIDSLRVRGSMLVYELIISKIRALIGALAISQGQGKIKTVDLSSDGTEYLITVEGDMSFVENDFIRCQTFSTNLKMYHVKISSIESGSIIHIPVSEFSEYTSVPEVGDDIVQFGNSTNAARQSAIYIHADEQDQPAIDVMFDIKSKDWTNCVKIRIGGNIPGTNGLKGLYVENGMLKGTNSAGQTVYCIYPDGTAEFGNGSAQFKNDKSGYLAGGAISWKWDATKNKFVTTLGNVLLSWDNLDDETKENLKGAPGTDGKNGITYYTWVMYSNSSTGSGMSSNPSGMSYIGLAYNKETPTASNNPSDYSWSKIKGDTGTDGKTYYMWIRYSPNADGSNLTSTPDSNTAYIGIAANRTTAEASNTPSDYQWSKFKGENGKDGTDANMLDWVSDWNNNKTLIGGDYIVSPKMFSGTKDADGKLTGVAFGRNCIKINGTWRTGIFSVVKDKIIFALDPVTQEYKFMGTVEVTDADGNVTTKIDGSTGELTSKKATLESAVVQGKIVTSLSGKRVEINPTNNSLKMFNQDNLEVCSLSFLEETWNGTLNSFPLFRIRQYHGSDIVTQVGISQGIVDLSQTDSGIIYDAHINPKVGITFFQNGVLKKTYDSK